MNNTDRIQDPNIDAVKSPTRKHFLIALAFPLVILLTGIFLWSAVALLGLILIIVSIAITAGMLMAAVRIKRQSSSEVEAARWETRTFPLTSLLLIVGIASALFYAF